METEKTLRIVLSPRTRVDMCGDGGGGETHLLWATKTKSFLVVEDENHRRGG